MAAHPRKKTDAADSPITDTAWSAVPPSRLFDMFETQLALWRHNADLSRRLIRRQQDQMLKLWRGQLAQLDRNIPQPETGAPALMSFSPMIAAMKAAEQMGELALEAQRDAIEAMRPH